MNSRREEALELLFRLIKLDPEGRRHTRQRMLLSEAIEIAGGGRRGRHLIDHLAGTRDQDSPYANGSLRLITISGDDKSEAAARDSDRWVNLIHEMLVRSRESDDEGRSQPYWPTFWHYIERNKQRAVRRERLQILARSWQTKKGFARLFGLAGWSAFFDFRKLAAPGSVEQRYLRWSRVVILIPFAVVSAFAGLLGEAFYWKIVNKLPLEAVWMRWAYKLGKELPLPTLVNVPEGSFAMGSGLDGEAPIHDVTFSSSFYLSETEITFAQYDTFARATGRSLPVDRWGRGEQPVINIDWLEARAYTHWLGAMTGSTCRLPSEAEWEYACRAGTKTPFAVPVQTDGSDDIEAKGLANCKGCGGEWEGLEQTAPVRSFPENAWDLHDMHGNVWEWVEDCFHASYEGAPRDGRALIEQSYDNCKERVFRGGSWLDDDTRCAVRGGAQQFSRGYDLGFRVACSIPSEDQ